VSSATYATAKSGFARNSGVHDTRKSSSRFSGGFLRSAIDREYEGSLLTPDEDRLIILGNAILCLSEVAPEDDLSIEVLAFLDGHLDDAGERALFNLCPLLD